MKKGDLWRLADELRSAGKRFGILDILELATKRGIPVETDEVRELLASLGRDVGRFYTPKLVTDVILLAAAGRSIKVLCDPWAGAGLLVTELTRQLKPESAIALCEKEQEFPIARMLDRTKLVKWVEGHPLTSIDDVRKNTVDFIASVPPMGHVLGVAGTWEKKGPLLLADDEGSMMLFYASLRLAREGLAAYIVPEGFFALDRHRRTREAVVKNGMRFKAVLTLPAQAFYPFTSIRTCLVLIEHGEQGPIFAGQLADDSERNSVLFANLRSGSESREVALGKYVELSSYRGFSAIEADFRVHQLAAESGQRLVRLGDISTQTNLTKSSEPPGFEEQPNSIYLPLIGRSDVVASLADLGMKPHNYAQVVIKPELADSRYLAAFLNSATGVYLREQARTGLFIPKIRKSTVASLYVLLPDVKTQEKTVEGEATVGRLISELGEIGERIWSSPQKIDDHLNALAAFRSSVTQPSTQGSPKPEDQPFQEWLEDLPFPLASVLWRYHASGENSRDRFELLLKFFEAVAEFHAILLLSAFKTSEPLFSAVRREIAGILLSAHLTFERSTFGTWKAVVEYLSKRGRTMLGGDDADREACMDLFCTRDAELLNMLFSKELVALIQTATGVRNIRVGHGGVVTERLASEWHASLLPLLESVRRCFGLRWCNYELIQPLACDVLEGAYKYEALRLMGSRAPFEKVKRHTADRLVTNELYVLSKDMGRALRLIPLIKVGPSPIEESNSCFFFNRRENGQLKFISYHFVQQPELTQDFPDARHVLDMLTE